MIEKKKVFNDYNVHINLNFKALNGKVVALPPRSYAYITEEELLYLTHSSSVIQEGLVRVDGTKEEVHEDVAEAIVDSNVFTEERFAKLLKMTVKNIQKELESITNVEGLSELRSRAESEDKPKSYVEAVQSRIAELAK